MHVRPSSTMGPRRCVALHLLIVLWTELPRVASFNEAIHPLALDMPTSPDDTGFVPADMIAAMNGQQESFQKEGENDTSEEDIHIIYIYIYIYMITKVHI